jgi:hypothetical protein
MRLKQVIVALIGLSLSGPAFAWNDFGHMLVAAVAYKKLTPKAKEQVAALLRRNPNYQTWVAFVPEARRDEVAFVMAATWPDFIKRDNVHTDDSESPTHANASKNIGYTDKLMHRYWHYIDLPFSPDQTTTHKPQVPNAKTQIAAFRQVLASKTATIELKSYDLVWLEHLVGDVHQPLHATSRFTQAQPKGDDGGNGVKLTEECCKQLHSFWDGVLGTSRDPRNAIAAAVSMPPVDPKLAALADEQQWLEESLAIAKATVYAAPVGVGEGPFTLNDQYRKKARDVARRRAALAGARLANLLNAAFK